MCEILSLANNNARIGGEVHSEASIISIGPNVNCGNTHTTIDIWQNSATYSWGSISSIDNHLYFTGSVLFDGNTAGYGGAMALDGTSSLMLTTNLTLRLKNNIANEKGGILYYDHSVYSCGRFEQYYSYHLQCFVSFEDISL